MKNKIIISLMIFVAFLLLFCCSVNAANVLIISEEEVVHGETVASMLGKIAADDFTVEEVAIENGKTLTQTVDEIIAEGKTYDSVIVQLPYSNSGTIVDNISAINELHIKLGSNESTQYFVGSAVGKIANYDQEIITSKEATQKIMSGVTATKVSAIPTFENIKTAADKSLEVCSNNKLTTLGDLLIACTYSNSLGKKVTELVSYDKLVADEVKSVVEIANASASASASDVSIQEVPSSKSYTEESTAAVTENTTNSATIENTTNNVNSTEEKVEERGTLSVSKTPLSYVTMVADREPSLKYDSQNDYLYIEIRDPEGIACEYPSIDGENSYEADKNMQPRIYYYKNDKRGNLVSKLKRPTASEYAKIDGEFVYRIGLPVSEITENYTKFEIVAYDVKSSYKQQFFIDEVFMVKKDADGKILVNRAPTSEPILLKLSLNRMGLHAVDDSGISSVEMKTLPIASGGVRDTIGRWNGSVKNNWSTILDVTQNNKYVKDGLTRFEKIDTLFKKSNWIGLNPKVSNQEGTYIVMVEAADVNGSISVKTLSFDTNNYLTEDGNALVKNSALNVEARAMQQAADKAADDAQRKAEKAKKASNEEKGAAQSDAAQAKKKADKAKADAKQFEKGSQLNKKKSKVKGNFKKEKDQRKGKFKKVKEVKAKYKKKKVKKKTKKKKTKKKKTTKKKKSSKKNKNGKKNTNTRK